MKRNRVYLPQSLPLPFSAEQLDPLPRLIAILESSFDGIFVTDAQARPIWCNHSYEVISGLTAQEVLGVPMGELVRRGTISHSATLEALAQGPGGHHQPDLHHRQAGGGHQHPHLRPNRPDLPGGHQRPGHL